MIVRNGYPDLLPLSAVQKRRKRGKQRFFCTKKKGMRAQLRRPAIGKCRGKEKKKERPVSGYFYHKTLRGTKGQVQSDHQHVLKRS